MDTQVCEAYDAEKGRTGSPRVVRRLREQGRRAGHHQVANSMRRHASACESRMQVQGHHQLQPQLAGGRRTCSSRTSIPIAPIRRGWPI
ncbi:IS3 family transposase [Dyella sp.]|uniref:IS3 family transposase n=1 Tax=Dyella sp. TaxID=1869338 RepID=UPI0039C86E87